jgi:hypothetical protein
MQTSRDCLHHLKNLAVAARQKAYTAAARARDFTPSPYFVKGWTHGYPVPLLGERVKGGTDNASKSGLLTSPDSANKSGSFAPSIYIALREPFTPSLRRVGG